MLNDKGFISYLRIFSHLASFIYPGSYLKSGGRYAKPRIQSIGLQCTLSFLTGKRYILWVNAILKAKMDEVDFADG